jgi:hypothetical protein
MVPLRMASISGFNGPRGSLFHGSATNVFGLGAASSRPSLGQTGQEIYNLAKKELAQFDNLVERTKRLANKASRDAIIENYGLTEPANKDKALYARNVVASDIARAESYTPPNYDIYYAPGPTKNRPGRLEDWNDDFRDDVKSSEATYGSLPEPVVIERLATETVTQTPAWVTPVVIGALGLGTLALLGVFGKK